MSAIRDFLEQIAAFWNRSSSFARVGAVLGIVLLLGIVMVVGVWSSQPQYIALASELAPSHAAEIISRMESNGIRHQMNFSGSSVLVDKSDWNRARLLVTMSRLFSSSSQLEGGALGDPQMNRVRIHHQREEALARTIKTMTGIANAVVYLAIEERSLFTRESSESTASVSLELHAGAHFTREQAATIVTFVANSVEGLTPSNVSVVDTRGRLLSSSAMLGGSEFTANFEYRRQLETELAAKANTMLSQLVGEGRAMVRVSADLDFTCMERTETRYDPDIKVPSQQEIHSLEITGQRHTTGGVAGIDSHIQNAANGVIPSRETEETNNTYYDTSKTEETVRECPGGITRLTVAVMVDLRTFREAVKDEADPDTKSKPRPELSEDRVAGIVKQAVGFDESRGDEIEVLITEFVTTPTSIVPIAKPNWDLYSKFLRNGSLGIASLVALLLGSMTLKKMRPVSIRVAEDTEVDDPQEMLLSLTQRMQSNPETAQAIISAWLDDSDGSQQRAA